MSLREYGIECLKFVTAVLVDVFKAAIPVLWFTRTISDLNIWISLHFCHSVLRQFQWILFCCSGLIKGIRQNLARNFDSLIFPLPGFIFFISALRFLSSLFYTNCFKRSQFIQPLNLSSMFFRVLFCLSHQFFYSFSLFILYLSFRLRPTLMSTTPHFITNSNLKDDPPKSKYLNL